MNKTDLIAAIAQKASLKRKDAAAAVDALVGVVRDELAKGGEVSITGFGTFAVRERSARTGRNPRTGETIAIAAGKSPVFRAGKSLKDALGG
ncbi:MAG: HU family DNA-binding protein [Armatimonadota bacterium]|nr:HU family DNA-binding protein [Armatimonadota bacterium]